MDECDVSAVTAAKYLKSNIIKARSSYAGPGSLVCVNCGEDIEPARKQAVPSCTRCILCQKEWERKSGNY